MRADLPPDTDASVKIEAWRKVAIHACGCIVCIRFRVSMCVWNHRLTLQSNLDSFSCAPGLLLSGGSLLVPHRRARGARAVRSHTNSPN